MSGYPVNRGPAARSTSVYMPDASTAGSAYIAAPCRGYIKKLTVTTQGTPVTVGDNTFTVFINGNAVTLTSALVQNHTTDAAGTVWSSDCANDHTALVNEGDTIKVTSDGAGSSVVPVMIGVIVSASAAGMA